MAEIAHGVVNNHIPEDEAVARLQRLRFRGAPSHAGATEPVAQQTHDDGQAPRDGRPDDVFEAEVVLTEKKNGAWVRRRMRELRLPGTEWHLTGSLLWGEVLRWFDVNRDDIAHGEAHEAATTTGKSVPPHRPRALTFIVTEDCFRSWARGKVWDLRAYWDAKPSERSKVPITLMRFEEFNTSFDSEVLRRVCKRAHITDEEMVQYMTTAGIWRPFVGEWSMVLQPNAKGFYESIGFAQETTNGEIENGFLSKAYKYPMFLPMKIHSRNVAWQFRNGKTKPRGTGDLGLHGDWSEHSTNAGWPLDKFPDYEYGSSEHFARDCGVVRTAFNAATGFEIRKNDWKGESPRP